MLESASVSTKSFATIAAEVIPALPSPCIPWTPWSPVVPCIPCVPCVPCGPVAPKPLKSKVVPSYVKSLPDTLIVGLLVKSVYVPVNATVESCVLLLFNALATSAKLSKFTLAPPLSSVT